MARDARDAGASERPSPPLAPVRVVEIQRQRLLVAMAAVAAERGAANVTVAQIVTRAGVSRRTFYEQFADRDECFIAAFEQALIRARDRVLPAYEAPEVWRERIRAALAAGLAFMDEEPGMARLLVVEALGGGPKALARRRKLIARLIAAVDEGRGEVRGAREPPPLTAEGAVGAVLSIVHARLLNPAGATPSFASLLNELMAAIVLPYLGPTAARRELHKPTPTPPPIKPSSRIDPLAGLRMRLTYRTLRVLTEIAVRPGASNRQIAAAAEIADQGQMSKLLARLEDLGLIENRGEGHIKGQRNAWHLTARGKEVSQAAGA